MELYQLKPKHKLKKRKRVGRGGKRGTYAGRGVKGQRARAGRRLKPAIREFIKRYPKLRGYKFKRLAPRPAIINIETLEKKFKTSETVSPKALLEKKIIRRIKGRIPKVKILARGKITKELTIDGCQVSKGAKEQIKKAGGSIK